MSQAIVRALGLLMMLCALAIPLVHAPDRSVDSLVARWAPPPSDFMEVRGQIVHFRDEGPRGDDTPLVLLHGTASSLHTWEGWAAALRGARRVISLDLPGSGLTGPFAGDYVPDDYHADALARFTLDFLDARHVARFAIGGNSLGGEVAWRVAARAPDRVTRLVLVDAGGYPSTPLHLPVGLRVARTPVLSWAVRFAMPRDAVEASVRDLYGDPRKVTPQLVDRYREMLLREGNRRALGLRMADLDTDLAAERIKSLRLPTLVLWGGSDRLIPPDSARRFAADIPGARLVLFPGLGHVPQEEDPALTVAPVRAFLGLAPPSPALPPPGPCAASAACAPPPAP